MLLKSLKEFNQWVCWGFEEGRKIPISPTTGNHASVTAKSTWRSFQEASKVSVGEGVGFVFTEEDPFFGVDIDDCVDEDGNFSGLAKFAVRQLKNCYMEYSPSGKGLHIIGRGKVPTWASKNKQSLHLEIYDKCRYFTMTFDKLPDSADDPGESQEGLENICLKYMVKAQDKDRPKTNDSSVPKYEEGQRDDMLFSLAQSLFNRGTPKWLAIIGVAEAAKNCNPPMEEAEKVAKEKVNSAWKCGDPHPGQVVKEINERYCLINGKTVVERDKTGLIFHDLSAFKCLFLPYTLRIETKDGKFKEMTQAEYWLKSEDRGAAKNLVCKPINKVKENEFNIWQGMAYKPKKGDCSLYLDHIWRNVAAENKEIYDWIIEWMASVVQDPEGGPVTCLVLRGGQGVGKGMFANHFKELFGHHGIVVSQSSHFVGRFNSHLADKALIFADEAIWGGDKKAEGELKHLITDSKRTIEPKGHESFEINNCAHLIMASNENWVVPAGIDDRRFMVVDIKHKDTPEFFSRLQKQMTEGGREALLYYLLYQVKPKDPRMPTIATEAQKEQKEHSSTSPTKVWIDWIEQGFIDKDDGEWPRIITRRDLYNAYLRTAGEYGYGYRVINKHFWKESVEKILPWYEEIRGNQLQGKEPLTQTSSLDDEDREEIIAQYEKRYSSIVKAENKSYIVLPKLSQIKDNLESRYKI